VLVNSAAVMVARRSATTSVDDWAASSRSSARAFFLAQAAAPLWGRARSIVNIADLAAFETWPGYVRHGLTKGALVHMTRSLARVLAPKSA